MGCHSLLQGILLTQGSDPSLLHWQADSLASEIPGKPWPRAVFPVNVFSGDSLSLPVFAQGQGSRVLVWSQILLGFRVPSLCHSESQQCSPPPQTSTVSPPVNRETDAVLVSLPALRKMIKCVPSPAMMVPTSPRQ